MEPYYYQRLSKPMQEAYHAIKRGVESLSPAFPVPRLEMEQLSVIANFKAVEPFTFDN